MTKTTTNKMCITVLTIVGSLLLIISSAWAANLKDIIDATKAKQIEFEKNVQDMTIHQVGKTSTPQGEAQTDIVIMKKGPMFRMETAVQMPPSAQMPQGMGEMKSITVFDGKQGWVFSVLGGKQQLTPEQIKQLQASGFWWAPLLENAELLGTEDVNGRQCYKLKVKEDELLPFTGLWLDKDSLVAVKAEAKGPQGQPTILLFSDFHKIGDNHEIPYRTETRVSDEVMTVLDIKEIKINIGLPDEVFDPDGVELPEGPDMQELIKKMQEKGN